MVDLLRTDPRAAWSVALFMACALVILGGGIGAALFAAGLRFYLRGREFLAKCETTLTNTAHTQAHASRVAARLIVGAAAARRAHRRSTR